MTTDTIKAIQKQIVDRLEAGEDASALSLELAQERAKVGARIEIEELQKVADKRLTVKGRAEAVKVKVQKQGAAIDQFLEMRDTMVSQLQPLIEPMKGLAKLQNPSWEREPGECYLISDVSQFNALLLGIPEGYLPADFGCPFIEMAGGVVDARGKAAEAFSYLQAACGILASFQKGISTITLRPAEGLMGMDDEPDTGQSCAVCQHEKKEAISQAIVAKRPLRELEVEFGISRSTLSRHKIRCLNLGAIQVRTAGRESPAVSSNQTFFRG